MIASTSNGDGAGNQGGSSMDLASQAEHVDHGTSSGPAVESRPFPWAELAMVAVVVAFGFYCGRIVKRAAESIP